MQSRRKQPEVNCEGGVFVIEDSEVMQRRYQAVLEQNRIGICAIVGSGREAVLLAPRISPDVIILDHELPDGTGLHIIAALRSFCPEASIVVISGVITASLAQQYLAQGVCRLMGKPINEAELVHLLRGMLVSQRQIVATAG